MLRNSQPRFRDIHRRARPNGKGYGPRHGALAVILLSVVIFDGAGQSAHAASVAAGAYHSLLLRNDGSLWGWGGAIYGEIGEGSTGLRSVPVHIMSGVQAVAGGDYHTLALKKDGSVWAFGRNQFGQIGDGTIGSRVGPVQVLSDASGVTGGFAHSLAVKNDGTLWAWGLNASGQLGDGSLTNRTTPFHVLSNVRHVAAGGSHTLAIKSDGTLWAWGSNGSGQLGNGNLGGQVSLPVQVMTNVQMVAAGAAHSVALKADGSIWVWGSNFDSQLGTGATGPQPVPAQLMTDVRAVAAGRGQSLALKTDGSLFAWGRNDYAMSAQIDRANTRHSPTRILSGVESMAAGSDHALALLADGTTRAWGGNSSGQLGDGTTVIRGAPIDVMDSVQFVAAGPVHSLAIKNDGTLWAWGQNYYGQLGDGTNTHRGKPTQVFSGVKAAAAGALHSMAIRFDGMLWAWGGNFRGQLGNGTTQDSTVPGPIMLGVQSIAGGFAHSLALKTDGTLWAWGSNDSGQLGDGTKISRSDPAQVMTDVKAIAAGDLFSLALKTDGTVWTWGSNIYGQLGDGTRVERTTPGQVQAGVEAIDAGLYHSMILKTDGSVWTWGLNTYGQLGLGTTRTGTLPAKVVDGIKTISAGGVQSLALRPDGTLLAWGLVNMPGAGILTRPRPNVYLPAIRTMATGNSHALAITTAGRLLTWGTNGWQQLGIERPMYSSEPVIVRDPLSAYAGTSIAVEYFNPTILNGAGTPGIGHYFLAADTAEIASIDAGGSGLGWARTGRGFRVWLDRGNAPPDAVPVHRFYARAPNSHFYTANESEYRALRAQNAENDPRVGWAYEGIAFHSVSPSEGRCTEGYYPVYRAYNNRFSTDPSRNDGNHRIAPSFNDHQRSVRFLGYVDEGIALCSPIDPNSGGDLQATFGYPGATAESGAAVRVEFVFGNNGAGKGDGGSVYAALPATVSDWKLTCVARLGATCPQPAHLTPASLRTGVSVSTWPAGGSLTIVAEGTAPAIGTNGETALLFAATVANASGSPDATPTNDTPPATQTALKAATVCSPVVNPRSLHLGSDAHSPHISLVIGDGCAWASASDSAWANVEPATGTGDSTVRLELAANDSVGTRQARLFVAGQEILVTQAGAPCSFSVVPASLSFNATGGTTSIDVRAPAGCIWTVDNAGSPWLAASPVDGNGSRSILLSASNNIESNNRSGALAIGNFVVQVTQGRAGLATLPPTPLPRPDPCATLRLQREGDQISPSGLSGDVGIDVIADGECIWRARSNDEWLTLTAGAGGNGSGVVRYLTDANPSLAVRQGTITIGTKVFTVNQTANPIEAGSSDGGGDGSSGGSGSGSGGSAG